VPFTPYHFGPGLLLKGAAPRHVSFLSYCTTQVAIDLESWHYLTGGEPHVHRILHTFVFGALAGLAIAGLVWLCGAGVHHLLGRHVSGMSIGTPLPVFRSELSLRGVVLGGLLGGVTHALLDGVMHGDVQPLRPFSLANPLYGLIGWKLLHSACLVAGAVGALALVSSRRSWRAVS